MVSATVAIEVRRRRYLVKAGERIHRFLDGGERFRARRAPTEVLLHHRDLRGRQAALDVVRQLRLDFLVAVGLRLFAAHRLSHML
jgi:hypothetical protein